MLRDSTGATSANAGMLLSPIFNNIDYFSYRTASGASVIASGTAGISPVWWVRVVRSGNTFSGFDSPDGVTWTQRGSSVSVTMGTDVLAGIAVGSGSSNRLNTALIDNVRIVGTPDNTGPLVSAGSGGTVTVNQSLTLSGTVQDDALPALISATTVQWSQQSGPGTAVFASATSPATTVTLPVAGTYTLRLTGSDGEVQTFSDVIATAVADTTPPTVIITPNGTATSLAPIVFTLTFSESVTGLTAVSLGVGNGSVSAISGSGTAWTASVTPAAQGAVTCQLLAGGVQDLAGNACAASAIARVTWDTVPPAVTLDPPSLPITAAGPASFAITYSDANFSGSSLAAAQVILNRTGTANATVSVAGSGAARTVTLSAVTGDGTLGISLPAGTAVDTAGQSAPAAGPSATVRVDNTRPAFPTLSPVVAEATGPTGAAVIFPAITATDGSSLSYSFSTASGSLFPLGTTPVTVTATDAAGNAASAVFQVTVRDTVVPVITGLPNLTVEAAGPSGSFVTFSPGASDAVGVTSLTSLPASGTRFALGTTPVTVTAKDAAGNTATTGFQVTVRDTVAPVLAALPDLTAEATGPAGATVAFSPGATDAVGVTSLTALPASGNRFALGTTPVTVTVKDAAGNTATATFQVTVRDTVAPALATLPNLIVEATGPSGAIVTFSPVATDAVGVVSLVASPVSGTVFPGGLSTVTITATDAAGNSVSSGFTVLVRDSTPPTLAAPAAGFQPLTLRTGADGTAALPDFAAQALASDAVGVAGATTQSPPAGTPLVVGAATVTLAAVDTSGNRSTLALQVSIEDGTPPALAGPLSGFTPVNVATGPAGTALLPDYTAQAVATG